MATVAGWVRPVPRHLYAVRRGARGQWEAAPNPVVLGRKFCTNCGRWRLLMEFYQRSDLGEGVWQSECKTCGRLKGRWRNGINNRGRPYGQRKPKASADEAKRRRRERYREQMRTNPEFVENKREYGRIYAEGQRRKAGAKIDHARLDKRKVKGKFSTLEPEPLIEALGWHILAERDNGHPDFGWEEVARISGVPARRLWGWRKRGERIRIDKADRICVMVLGVPLDFIYQ